MINDVLTGIGFSPKEASLYVNLLRYGMQPISFLAKKSNLNRGTSYVILHGLLEKGLVVKTTKQKIQYFSPLEPKQLITYLEHKEQEIKNQQEKVKASMGEFLAIVHPLLAKPKIEFFDGVEGARAVLDDTLTAKDHLLRSFLSVADVNAFLGADWFQNYTDRRIKAGYTLHAIRTLEKDKIAFSADPKSKRYITNSKEKREIRYISENLAFPITMYFFDNKIAALSSKEENFALLIESNEMAEMQKKLFELMWNSVAVKQNTRKKK